MPGAAHGVVVTLVGVRAAEAPREEQHGQHELEQAAWDVQQEPGEGVQRHGREQLQRQSDQDRHVAHRCEAHEPALDQQRACERGSQQQPGAAGEHVDHRLVVDERLRRQHGATDADDHDGLDDAQRKMSTCEAARAVWQHAQEGDAETGNGERVDRLEGDAEPEGVGLDHGALECSDDQDVALRLGIALLAVNAFAVAGLGVAFLRMLPDSARSFAHGHLALRIVEAVVIIGIGQLMLATETLVDYEPVIFTGSAGLLLTAALRARRWSSAGCASQRWATWRSWSFCRCHLSYNGTPSPGLLLYVPGGLLRVGASPCCSSRTTRTRTTVTRPGTVRHPGKTPSTRGVRAHQRPPRPSTGLAGRHSGLEAGGTRGPRTYESTPPEPLGDSSSDAPVSRSGARLCGAACSSRSGPGRSPPSGSAGTR